MISEKQARTMYDPAEGGWGGARFVDIHCHCLPRLDDGPATVDEAVELLCLSQNKAEPNFRERSLGALRTGEVEDG